MVKLYDSEIKTREVTEWKGVHLLHHWVSSCSQKVRIALNLKGVTWNSHVVDMLAQKNFSEWYLGINPRGLVPALVHDGEVHIESNDIIVHIDDYFDGPSLLPAAHRESLLEELNREDDLHLDLRTLTFRFNSPFKSLGAKSEESLEKLRKSDAMVQGGEGSHKVSEELKFWENYAKHGITDAQVQISFENFQSAFDQLDQRLRTSPHLAGDTLTALDIAWFIYTYRLTVLGYPMSQLHPSVYRWYEPLVLRQEFIRELRVPQPLRTVMGGFSLMNKLLGNRIDRTARY